MATTTPRLSLRKPDPSDLVNVSTDINDNADKLDDPNFIAALVTDILMRMRVTGDTNERFHITAGGVIKWGPGNGATDTDLYRDSAGVLRTSSGLIVDGAFTMPDNTVVASKIAANAVTTAKILDANVTAAKLAASAVEEAKIAANAVTSGKIAAGAVGTSQLAVNAVTSPKLNLTFDVAFDATNYTGLSNTSFSATAGGVSQLEITNFAYQGGDLLIIMTAEINHDTAGAIAALSYQIRKQSDSSEITAASDERALRQTTGRTIQSSYIHRQNFTAQDIRVRLMHRIGSGTMSLDNRELILVEL